MHTPTFSIEETFPNLGPSDVLAGARGMRGVTQKQLAAQVGCHAMNISEMERGKRPISLEMSKRLAAALNVPYKAFL